MKKKFIISILLIFILIIGFISFNIWDNRVISTISLDINPSIKINLTKKGKVKNVIALNNDAKKIITNKYNNKTLDEVFELLITKLINKGYNDNIMNVILYTEGNIKSKDIAQNIEFIFGKKDIHTEIIIIDNITKDDEELAKKYNITPTKASYIKSIIDSNKNINIEYLKDKSVNELTETKITGNYCPNNYILEGDWCLKEKERIAPNNGEICPAGYYEYNGICYEETPSIESDKYICREEFKLNNNKCIREVTEPAMPLKYLCTTGTKKTKLDAGLTEANAGDANDIICVDTSNATHPVSPCEVNDGTEYTISGGKCYWHRAPVIAEGCPGKIQVGGFCWDDASKVLICVGARDGKQYNSRSDFCEGTVKYNNPIVTEYKCENKNAKLNDNKCIIEEIEDAEKEKYCKEGYSLVNKDKCINYNKTTNKENGLICEKENSRLKGTTCIIYEMIEAKHN